MIRQMDVSSDANALNTEMESEEMSQPDQMNAPTPESPAAAEDTPGDPVEPQSKTNSPDDPN